MSNKMPTPIYCIDKRRTPTCRRKDCDIVDQPEHWVDVTLCEPYASAPGLLEVVKEAQTYILRAKGFNIRKTEDFCIANHLAQAIKKAGGEL